jgi:hypothetical protein
MPGRVVSGELDPRGEYLMATYEAYGDNVGQLIRVRDLRRSEEVSIGAHERVWSTDGNWFFVRASSLAALIPSRDLGTWIETRTLPRSAAIAKPEQDGSVWLVGWSSATQIVFGTSCCELSCFGILDGPAKMVSLLGCCADNSTDNLPSCERSMPENRIVRLAVEQQASGNLVRVASGESLLEAFHRASAEKK